MTDLAIPTIHPNGTPHERLVEQLSNAVHALDDALKAIAEAEPNGRDFYPQGPDAIGHALEQHRQRLRAVHQVRNDYYKLWESIA